MLTVSIIGIVLGVLLNWMFDFVRFFGKAVDENFPLNPPKYTRFVHGGCIFNMKVWRRVCGPLYVRIPVSYARENYEMTPEMEAESKRQFEVAKGTHEAN
jgi:hypothetical protein